MTLSGAYMNDGFDPPNYPTAFGVTFTPKVFGIIAAVAGIGLAAYVGTQLVGPQLEQAQQLRDSISQKEIELQQKTATVSQLKQLVSSLNQAKVRQAEVRGLFSQQKALDTLLLDLNREMNKSGATLLKFTPEYGNSGVISDGSLGPELNLKLKRQVTDVSFRGTFAQTLSIMQSIDKLQTVLVVQDLNLSVAPDKKDADSEESSSKQVTSKFKLYAYVPLTSEEIAAVQAQQATQAKEAEKK